MGLTRRGYLSAKISLTLSFSEGIIKTADSSDTFETGFESPLSSLVNYKSQGLCYSHLLNGQELCVLSRVNLRLCRKCF